jgi:hypothetical protein
VLLEHAKVQSLSISDGYCVSSPRRLLQSRTQRLYSLPRFHDCGTRSVNGRAGDVTISIHHWFSGTLDEASTDIIYSQGA